MADLSSLEHQILEVGPRPEWRLERVWEPKGDPDDDPCLLNDPAAKDYTDNTFDIGGYWINPYDLDQFSSIASWIADLHEDTPTKEQIGDALTITTAGIVVLQQALPYPFVGILDWGQVDNRPALRLLYNHACLVWASGKPRQAAKWLRAIYFMSPYDALGVR